jgi:hypothetical protein
MGISQGKMGIPGKKHGIYQDKLGFEPATMGYFWGDRDCEY